MDKDSGDGESKRLNEGVVEYMSKRSMSEVPRFTVQLKKYIKLREKRTRAAFSRHNSDLGRQLRGAVPGKKGSANTNAGHEGEQNDKAVKENHDEGDDRLTGRRSHHMRSRGGSRGPEPRDRCRKKRCCRLGRKICCPRRCPKRRRRSCPRKKRRRSCPRKRRRRRSCRRKRRRRC